MIGMYLVNRSTLPIQVPIGGRSRHHERVKQFTRSARGRAFRAMASLSCDSRTDARRVTTPGQRLPSGRRSARPRARSPRSSHGDWQPAPTAPIRSTCSSGRPRPRARARAAALRAHARIGLHLLPRRRRDHGRRPRRHPDLRALGAGLRRRPPVELRGLRGPGPGSGRRHQRLRRDPARAVGVGRQAARGELRDRRSRPRASTTPSGGRSSSPPPRAYRAAHPPISPGCSNLDVWYERIDVSEIREAFAADVSKKRPQDASSATSPRRQRKDRHARLLEAHPPGRRRAPDRQRPSGPRAARGAVLGRRS